MIQCVRYMFKFTIYEKMKRVPDLLSEHQNGQVQILDNLCAVLNVYGKYLGNFVYYLGLKFLKDLNNWYIRKVFKESCNPFPALFVNLLIWLHLGSIHQI